MDSQGFDNDNESDYERAKRRNKAYQAAWRQRRKEKGLAIPSGKQSTDWRREYDRGRDRSEYYAKRDVKKFAKKFAEREFVGIDGEGWDLKKRHVLTLLGSSHSPSIYRKEGLSTEECLAYLLSLAQPGRVLVGFRFSYDVNMILADLTHAAIETICDEEWGSFWPKEGGKDYYRIRFTPNKSLYITLGHYAQVDGSWQWIKQQSAVIWDVFGFFQTSFLGACYQWKIGTEEELRTISEGKGGRRAFSHTDRAKITRYNDLECDLLVRLMNEVRHSLEELDIRIPRWDGAGAIANALHDKYNTRSHKPTTAQPDEAINRAFYGARVQRLRVGDHYNVWAHDINSAYPSTIRALPSLAGGVWDEVDRYSPTPDCALWEVSWDVGDDTHNPYYPLTPFPFRHREYGILYPQRGRGIYWGSLVRTAKQAWGDRVAVVRGWVFRPATDEKPFRWVEDLYQLRREKKAAGLHGEEKVLKLGYNSLYGKFSQGVGYFKGKPPAYQNFTWAGMVTAHCQARVLAAALQAPANIIAISTDGVFATKKLLVPETSELGEWSIGHYDRMFILQPGVYALWEGEDVKLKTRGFSPADLPLEKALEDWQERGQGCCLKINSTRFIGMHLARHWNKLETDWRQWVPIPRQLGVMSGSTMPDILAPLTPSMQCHPLDLPDEEVGRLPEAYQPRGAINLDADEHLDTILSADQG